MGAVTVVARQDVCGTRAAFRGASLSSQSLSPIVAALDAGLLMIASCIGSFSYRSYMMWGSARTDGSVGVGLLAAALFLLLAHSQGLYRLQSILNPARHLSRTLLVFGMSVLTLTCLLFLLKVGADYSRGSVMSSPSSRRSCFPWAEFSSLAPLILGFGRASSEAVASSRSATPWSSRSCWPPTCYNLASTKSPASR
jgi:hypothetical protein